MKIFHVSPIPSDVVIGESGWLFLGDKFGADIKESKGISVFSKQEIEKATKNILSYNAFLAEKKIKFYFCIAPNKLSVYNSYLPIQKSSRFTKVQQLTKELGKYQLNVIDLKDQFNLLPDIRLYHKHDSHWNQAGAFLGYLSIMKRIKKDFPGVSILKIEDFIINTTNSPYGDLTKNMLHMRVSEADITLTSIHKSTVVVSERLSILPKSWIPRFEGYTQRFKCEGKPLKVLVFCDSFFLNMVPFINRSFGETLVLNCLMNKDIVDTEKPDIIINETIERDIDIFLEMK
jgi:hypothetical protein